MFFYFLNKPQNNSILENTKQTSIQPSSAEGFINPSLVGPSGSAPGPMRPKLRNVSIANSLFNPPILNIDRGDTVFWTNDDSVLHQISVAGIDGVVMSKDQSYSFVFVNSGTFDYFCKIHPSMKGTIIVK